MFILITQVAEMVAAVLGLVLILVRVVESINELSKTPELSTYKKVWQVIVNFFTLEKYNATKQ